MGDEVYRGGAADPYNTATTSAKWATALRERDEARRKLLVAVLWALRENAKAVVDLAKLAMNRVYGRMIRGR